MTSLLQRGQIFAERYRVGNFLAKGGFGAVYEAEQLETEAPVALKVLWPHVFQSEDAVKQFQLEARVAGRIGSDHVVRVFDVGFDDKTRMPFLAMELLQGQDLERVVESRGPVTPDELIPYFLQIGAALDKAHGYVDKEGAKRPIVHRDLKPENLFIAQREAGGPIIKILDFGIAKVLNAESIRISTEFKGTPLFMASEQAGAGAVTPQTDIWSLGLIAFYVLTGEHYWKAANVGDSAMTQLFGEVLTLPLDPPSQRAVDVGSSVIPDARFDAWFARCVNRDPVERFATAGECAAQLATVLAEAPRTWRGLGAARVPRAARLVVAETAGADASDGPDSALVNTGDALTTRRSETLGLRRGLGSQQPTVSELRAVRPESGAGKTIVMGAILTVLGVGGAMWAKSGESDGIAGQSAAGTVGTTTAAETAVTTAEPAMPTTTTAEATRVDAGGMGTAVGTGATRKERKGRKADVDSPSAHGGLARTTRIAAKPVTTTPTVGANPVKEPQPRGTASSSSNVYEER